MDNEFNFESGRVRKKSSFIFGILRVDLGGDLGRFFFFWVVIGVDIGSVALPSCINFTSSSGTVARFGAAFLPEPLPAGQSCATWCPTVRVRVVGGIANKIMEFKTKCAMF